MTQNNNNLPPVLPGKTPPPIPNGFSDPIYGKLRCPSELATFDIIGWFDHPENPYSWVQHIPMLGDIEAWWSLRLGSPIARANGIGGEEIPDGFPPLRAVPKGYDRWAYRGKSIKDITGPYLYAYPDGEEWITPEGWPGQEYGSVHYIEAVKEPTSDPCESESPKPEEIRFADMTELVKEDEPTPPKPEGETPLTDGEIHYRVGREDGWNEIVRANFARQLESDLAAARAEVEMSKEAIDDLSADFEQAKGYISTLKFDQLTLQTQLHNANLRNERLRAALEADVIAEDKERAFNLYKDAVSAGESSEYYEPYDEDRYNALESDFKHQKRHARELRDEALESALAPASPDLTHEPDGWRPIETAPKDGTKILLYVVHPADDYAKTTGHPDGWNAVESGYWNAHPDRGWENETAGTPSHWMPLPTAPASSGKGEG